MNDFMGNTKCLKEDSPKPEPAVEIPRLFSNRFCPYAKRVKIFLAHLKIDHETINIDLNSKPKWFREVSPLAKVPVYENNGSFTPDSVDIINLLAKDNKFELSKILSQGEFNGFMEQIVSLWYKICYYKDLSVIGTFEEALKNFAALESFGVLSKCKTLEFDDVLIWPWMEMINLTHWEVIQRHDALKTYISNKSRLEPMKLTRIPADVFKRFASSHDFDIDL